MCVLVVTTTELIPFGCDQDYTSRDQPRFNNCDQVAAFPTTSAGHNERVQFYRMINAFALQLKAKVTSSII